MKEDNEFITTRSDTATKEDGPWSITLPLEPNSGGTNSIRATLCYKPVTTRFGSRTYIPKKIYKIIIDTGSPYLVVADGMEYTSFFEELNTSESEQGAVSALFETIGILLEGEFPYIFGESNYGPTEEIYGSQKGNIEWKESFIQFRDERLSRNTVLGVLDDKLVNEAGGPLLGLVKRSNFESQKVQLRPTFFDQQRGGDEIRSFQIDCPNRLFTLTSGKSLISEDAKSDTVIPLVDLRPLGDFVEHYACTVMELQLDGNIFTPSKLVGSSDGLVRPIVAVFDSGLTGCLFTQPLWDILQQNGVKLQTVQSINVGVSAEESIISINNTRTRSKVRVGNQKSKSLYHFQTDPSMNPFYNLSPISLDWFDDEDTCPHVVVLGQTFLTQGCLTIDIDDRRATFVKSYDIEYK